VTTPRKAAPKDRKAPISAARKAAFDILLAVEKGQSHSDDLLRGKAVNALSPADRNLATTLVLGVLRWQIRLDRALQSLLRHPNARLDAPVRIALRLGAFQLLFLDRIPAPAAIDESVELSKHAGHRFASAMVNAVLRKLNAAPRQAYPEEDESQLALAQAHPAWMVARWTQSYGFASARAICHHGQQQPALTVRMVDPAAESQRAADGIVLQPGTLLSAARIVISGDVASTKVFRDGHIRFQDEGSQLAAEIAAAHLRKADGKILDACAAPGGKTLILAERNPRARIVACDASEPRVEQLRKRLASHHDRIECRLADASNLDESAVFDLVLADVPCSGTGTLGRNPEIRHRLHFDDLARQAERQRDILHAALRAARPGGSVVYSTCSLEPEENEKVVAAVLAETPGARLVSLQPSISDLLEKEILTASGAEQLRRCLTPEGALRLLPGISPTDGFFIALIGKDL
jgi:16S rRNA (cytosine967-C5)-methyltransferase